MLEGLSGDAHERSLTRPGYGLESWLVPCWPCTQIALWRLRRGHTYEARWLVLRVLSGPCGVR